MKAVALLSLPVAQVALVHVGRPVVRVALVHLGEEARLFDGFRGVEVIANGRGRTLGWLYLALVLAIIFVTVQIVTPRNHFESLVALERLVKRPTKYLHGRWLGVGAAQDGNESEKKSSSKHLLSPTFR